MNILTLRSAFLDFLFYLSLREAYLNISNERNKIKQKGEDKREMYIFVKWNHISANTCREECNNCILPSFLIKKMTSEQRNKTNKQKIICFTKKGTPNRICVNVFFRSHYHFHGLWLPCLIAFLLYTCTCTYTYPLKIKT